jgi:hypothetical protein
MKNWISGKQKHIIVWGVLLIYLLSANQLYVQLILKNGKPISTIAVVPAETIGVIFRLSDFLQPLRVNGQDLVELKGYAFTSANPKAENKITIILNSATQNLAFSTRANPFPNMIESYKGYTRGMDHAEFSLLLSKNALKPGTYKIGILLEEIGGANQSYVLTGCSIQTTPNTIRYIPGT